MRAIIHYNGQYEDSIEIKGDTIRELREIAFGEINKRGWKEECCWSEVLDKGEGENK
jgi:hypothetical protein